MIDRCDDPKCPGHGQKCVDRGYGYPVCPSQKWFSERFPGSENKPLAAEYWQYTGWKIEFRGKYDHVSVADISLEYADLYDEKGNDAGVIAIFAETWQAGEDTKWTGNAEVCFRSSDSEELDIISVESVDIHMPEENCDEQDERNCHTAKALIRGHLIDAKRIETQYREDMSA